MLGKGKRQKLGSFFTLVKELEEHDFDSYRNYLRMSPESFNIILKIIRPHIEKLCITREPISPEEQLALTLRYCFFIII